MQAFRKVSIIVVALLLMPAISAVAGEYELTPIVDALLGAGTVGMIAVSELPGGKAGTPDSEANINSLDRQVIAAYSRVMDDVSTAGAYAMLVLPALSVMHQLRSVETLVTYASMYAEAFFLTMGTKNLLKIAISRYRPYTYRGEMPAGEENEYYNSFPSGHTAFAFLGATFLSQTFLTEFPDSAFRLPVIIGSYALASAVGVLRVLSGNHFITDVIAGGLIGAFYGWIIPALHADRSKGLAISLLPSNRGFLFTIET